MTSNEKWILYTNVELKRSCSKWNEPPSTTPKASLPPKKLTLCIWWDWKGVLYFVLLPKNQMINSNKYCSQLDQLKATLDEKHPELVNRKRIIFHQDNARLHVSLVTDKNCYSLAAKFWFLHRIHQTLHLQISIYFGATPCPRSGGCMGAGGPRGATPHSRSGGGAVRRYPSSKIRSSGCALLEQPWRDTPCPR